MMFLLLILATLTTTTAVNGCIREENLALQGVVSQSGTIRSATFANDGDARPAQMEGVNAQCALTKPHNAYLSWWQVNLQDAFFFVSNVEIYTPDANFVVGVGYSKINDNAQTVTTPSDISLCKTGTRDEETGKLVANCSLSGQYVTIITEVTEEQLSLCEVQIYGQNRANLALGKDTKQSSDVYNAVSSLAVDGKHSSIFYYSEGNQLIPTCTHTSEETDLYPWWRVDLGNFFLVRSLDIYNRGEGLHSRLHDIEIRVGNDDILTFTTENKLPDEVVGDVLFTDNLLCASVLGDSLTRGKNEISCSQPTLGRYVSIQITKLCNSYNCQYSRADVKNMLTLCEVEVYGQKIDIDLKDVADLSLGKEMITSFYNSEEVDVDAEFSWINIDLQDNDVIYVIEIEPDTDTDLTDMTLSSVEIRVGNKPISSAFNNEHFTQNQLCAPWQEIFKNPLIVCKYPVIGRYVTIQLKVQGQQCHGEFCFDNEMTLNAIQHIIVWGVPANSYRPSLNVAAFKPTTQFTIQNSGSPSLAVDRIIPDMNSDDDKCSLTVPRSYPWWRVDLKAPHIVDYVVIHFPSNNNITVISEIEVRVGAHDIADLADDSLFDENTVCQVEETDTLETKFRCESFDAARFVSVQFNNKRVTAESLQLCEVEVIGCEI